MDVSQVIDMGREALWVALLLSAPLLATAMAVGLVVSFLQALTQIQDQSIAFVPKILALGLAFAVALPWLLAVLMEYSQKLLANSPPLF